MGGGWEGVWAGGWEGEGAAGATPVIALKVWGWAGGWEDRKSGVEGKGGGDGGRRVRAKKSMR